MVVSAGKDLFLVVLIWRWDNRVDSRVICYMAFPTWSLYWRMEGSPLERKTKGHCPKGAHSWCRVKSERSSVQLRKWLNRVRRGLVFSQARTKATAQTCWIPLSLPLTSTPVQPEGSDPLPSFLVESHPCALNIDWILHGSPRPRALRLELCTVSLSSK